MPLENLLTPRLVEVGKLKIGGMGAERKRDGGGTYRVPEKYDHFIVTTLHRDTDERLVADAEVMDSLKEHADPDGKIRRLPVTLLSNEIEELLSARYVAYAGKRLAAASDGLVLTEFTDGPGGSWLKEPRPLAHTPETAGRWKLKLSTTLNVMVSSPASRWGGVYKFRTTSRITADQLYGSLVRLRELTGGILRGLPLRLVVRPMQVAPNGQPTTVYVVHVELAGSDLAAVRQQALDQMRYEVANVREVRMIQAQYRQLLAHEEEIDAEDIEEFELDGQGERSSSMGEGETPPAGAERASPPASPPLPPPSPPVTATDPVEVTSPAATRSLAARKGKDSQWCLDWLNKAFHTTYEAGMTFWSQIPMAQRRKLVEVLKLLDDAPEQPERF